MKKTPKTLTDIKETLIQKAKVGKRPAPEMAWNIRALGGYGWYLGVPLIIGVLVGRLLDAHFPLGVSFFWTLVALGVGFVIGLINAHLWLIREVKNIRKGEK